MSDKGFVKLSRNIKDKPWYGDNGTVRMYIMLLINAAWKDFDYDGMTMRRGQYVTSIARLGEMCGLTVRQTRTALSRLKATNDIAVQTTAKYSIITLNGYDVFPSADKTDDNLDDKHHDTVSDNRNRSKEEIEEIKKEEKEEAASPPPSPIVFENSYNSSPVNNPMTREQLVEKYGSENVAVYERRFDVWTDRRGITGGISKYGTIAKWLAEDGVVKRESSFDTDEVMKRIIARYKS